LALILMMFMVLQGSGKVFINEVELDPPGNDNTNDVIEWAELYNSGPENVDIGGWKLVTTHGNAEIVTIPAGEKIPAKGFYVPPNHLLKAQWLDNHDESVILLNSSGSEIDRTPTLTDEYDDNCAWSRYPDGGPEWALMRSSRGLQATGCFCQDNWLSCCFEKGDNVSDTLLDSCLEEHDAKSLWNVSCMGLERHPNNCSLEEDLGGIYEYTTSKYPETDVVNELNKSKSFLTFQMDQVISGEGFVNVVNRLGGSGIKLKSKEHGSGLYGGEDHMQIFRDNYSTEMDKDVSATYCATTLSLPCNRTVIYSSRLAEEMCAKTSPTPPFVGSNESYVYHYPWCWHVTNIKPENIVWFSSLEEAKADGRRPCCDCIGREPHSSVHESYRYAESIDRESHIKQDRNRSEVEIDSTFEGMGHIGILKKSEPLSSAQKPLIFESREDYVGSFRIYEKVSDERSCLSSDKSASGTGSVTTNKRIKESQKTYESGTGSYDSEEQINTSSNYIAKEISLVYVPTNQNLTDDFSIAQSMRWKEGILSRNPYISFIGEEYTGAERLDKETVASGLNQMETKAEFTGRANYRTIIKRGSWSNGGSSGPVYISALNVVEEWVKIHNRGDRAVDMTGWTLSDNGVYSRQFPAGFTLRPGSTITVHSGPGQNCTTDLYMGYNCEIWNNDGDCAILRDENGNLVDKKCTGENSQAYEISMDHQYEGDYLVRQSVYLRGVPRYDRPHLTVTKKGEIDVQNCTGSATIARYVITVENNGNRALGPICIRDDFPPGARFVSASVRPSELTLTSANWTLTHLSIGDVATIKLNLDVTDSGDSVVNRVETSGGYGEDSWTGDKSFDVIEI